MLQIQTQCPTEHAPYFATTPWLKQNFQRFYWIVGMDLWMPVGFRKQAIWHFAQIAGAPLHMDGSRPSPELESAFMEQALVILRAEGVDMIRQPSTHIHFQSVPTGARACAFGSYQVDLSQSEEELWAKVHQKHRNVIRKAEKDGVQIEIGAHLLPEALELFTQTLTVRSHVGMHSPEWFHTNVQNQAEHMFCAVARMNGEVHGAVFMPWNSQCCYYLYGGSCDKPHGGAMNLLHWKSMLHMKSMGVRFYDFVGARINPAPGSKYEGIQRFKERFGSTLSRGYLWKLALRPFKTKLYEWALRLRGGYTDIIDQEIMRQSKDSL